MYGVREPTPPEPPHPTPNPHNTTPTHRDIQEGILLQPTKQTHTTPQHNTTQPHTQEGIKGLFSGAVPRTLYIGPSTALFFVAYGAVRNYIHRSPKLAASWEQ